MKDDTVVTLHQPGSISEDPLTNVLRSGARQLLAQAVEAEVEGHIAAHVDLTDAQGRRRVVRHGYLPERDIQTGIGAVGVKAPRVRDRDPGAPGGRIGLPPTRQALLNDPELLQNAPTTTATRLDNF